MVDEFVQLGAACCSLFTLSSLVSYWLMFVVPRWLDQATGMTKQSVPRFAEVNEQTHLREWESVCKRLGWESPELCSKGDKLWAFEEMRAALPEFAKVWAQRPSSPKTNDLNVNSAFALWFTVRALKPKHIIENGVFEHGQTTWLARQAAGSKAWIYSLAFNPEAFLEYREQQSGRTAYFLGANHSNFGDANWTSIIPAKHLKDSIVLVNDHTSCVRRMQELLNHGFIHLWYVDNWKNSTSYSFNSLCSHVSDDIDTLTFQDSLDTPIRDISKQEHAANLVFLKRHLEAYFEFPPIFDSCGAKAPTALVDSPKQLDELKLPSLKDPASYLSTHSPYVRFRQLPHSAKQKQETSSEVRGDISYASTNREDL